MTRAEIYKSFLMVFKVPKSQHMNYFLRLLDKCGDNAGSLGWNYDVYSLKHSTGYSIAICNGYRNEPGRTIPLDMARTYEAKALDLYKSDANRTDKHISAVAMVFDLAQNLANL